VNSRLVVLGSCGAWPEANRACSGFVLEHAGARVILDLGYGTLPRLLGLLNSSVADGIDAVIVTHAHADHMVDLHGLFRARRFGRPGAPAIPLYAPDGVVARVTSLEEDGGQMVRQVFDFHRLPSKPRAIGPFRLESLPLPHWVPNAGIRLCAPGLTLAYTGDTGPDPALAELGRDADLFVIEATNRVPLASGGSGQTEPRMHLSAVEAGSAAAAARADRILLTHFWPGSDRPSLRDTAAEHFAGQVLLAEEGFEVELG
jgi:ribonuclease BN (tRNA processing enzyme)